MASHPFARTGRPRHPDVLTPAEWEVLAGVRDGLTNREIAERRGCDLETVRFHLRNVRRKLDVAGRDELRAFPGRPSGELERRRAQRRRRRLREQIPLVQVRDMRRALAFYADTLGLEVVARWPDDGGVPGWVALAGGAVRLMLRHGHPRRKVSFAGQPGPVTLNFYVDGLGAVRRALLAAGYACDEPQALFYGARECYARDPDGNEVALVEFAASEPVYMTTRKRTRRKEGRKG